MSLIEDAFSAAQQWLFESLVQPAMFGLGMGQLLDDGFRATGWLLVGLLQVLVLVVVIGPLQRWRPVEPVTDRASVRTDMVYTLIHRLGLLRVALFFTTEPLFNDLFGALRTQGWGGFQLDQVWPGVTDGPWMSFLIYLVVFDFVDYWIHRGEHTWRWWWALHAVHHSQRQMTMWSDNRNHLVDDVLRDAILVVVAQCIGVAPGQFVALVAITQLMENLQHANLRLSFGRWGERLCISPRFHRLHHAVGLGHEDVAQKLGGRNYGVLFPWWDVMFGTADFSPRYEATGIRDQVEAGRDYGRGFWQQQWLGLRRMAGLR